MEYGERLRNGAFCLDLQGENKQDIIRELVDLLAADGQIGDRDAVLRAVMERERKMSTGMQSGIAVPHGKTDSVNELAVAFGIKRDGVDFDSLDGEPARIFVMTVSPVTQTGPHVRYLAEVSKFLNSPDVRQRLLAAGSVDEILDILSE